jgi:hypothetical protein
VWRAAEALLEPCGGSVLPNIRSVRERDFERARTTFGETRFDAAGAWPDDACRRGCSCSTSVGVEEA